MQTNKEKNKKAVIISPIIKPRIPAIISTIAMNSLN